MLFSGGGHEAHVGRWLRSGRQPDLLQTKHGHVAGRRQEDVRLAAREDEGLLQ